MFDMMMEFGAGLEDLLKIAGVGREEFEES